MTYWFCNLSFRNHHIGFFTRIQLDIRWFQQSFFWSVRTDLQICCKCTKSSNRNITIILKLWFRHAQKIMHFTRVSWKVHRLTKKEWCHSHETWHALNSTFLDIGVRGEGGCIPLKSFNSHMRAKNNVIFGQNHALDFRASNGENIRATDLSPLNETGPVRLCFLILTASFASR